MARKAKPWFWKARNCWYVTISGTRHNLGADKNRAWDRFHELMRQPAEARIISNAVVSLIDRFLEWTQSKRAPDTYEWYRYRLQRFALRYPDLLVSELRPFHVEEWVDSYPHLSKTSRRNYIRSVKLCLRWATKLGYVERNPIAELEAPTVDRRETFMSVEEYAAFLDAIPDDFFRDLVIVTWETGCRPQELLGVQARHVDFDRKRWVFPTQESKGKRKPRIVYLTAPVMEITQRLADRHPTGKLFRNRNQQPWNKDAVSCAFDRVRIRMGQTQMREQGIEVTGDDIADLVAALMDKEPMFVEPADVEIVVGDLGISVMGESVAVDVQCDPSVPVVRLTTNRDGEGFWSVEILNIRSQTFEHVAKLYYSTENATEKQASSRTSHADGNS